MKKQIFIAAAFIVATGITAQLAAQVTATDALKTRTKSNNANEKTIQAAGAESVSAATKLMVPANGKEFTADEIKSSVTFRWTPLVPKPKEPVTYRLRVWQLMQAQSGSQAMRTNQPIVTKDVDNITQAVVSGIYTGPCRPPYLCDYIWSVETVGADGKLINEKLTPEISSFRIENSVKPAAKTKEAGSEK